MTQNEEESMFLRSPTPPNHSLRPQSRSSMKPLPPTLNPTSSGISAILGDFVIPSTSPYRPHIKTEPRDSPLNHFPNGKKSAKRGNRSSRSQSRADGMQPRLANTPQESIDLVFEDEGEQNAEEQTLRAQTVLTTQPTTTENTRPQPKSVPLDTSTISESASCSISQGMMLMNQQAVPPKILISAQDLYQKEGKLFDSRIKTWAQLKSYVKAYSLPKLTLETCMQAQAATFQNINNARKIAEQQRTRDERSIRPTIPDPKLLPASRLPSLREQPRIKQGPKEDTTVSAPHCSRSPAAPLVPPPVPPLTLTWQRADPVRAPGIPRVETVRDKLVITVTDPAVPIVERINIPELPSDAPANHPRVLKLWTPELLSLPTTQVSHLTLPDVIVSILYKYDKKQTTLQHFLSIKESPHFFFLFKSRCDKFHSWSIEREDHLITVGIERDRATNLIDNERPSGGHHDLSIQYSIINLASRQSKRKKQTDLNLDTDKDKLFIPGPWMLHGTARFPCAPPLHEFLFDTHPNRGAEDHETFHHTKTIHRHYGHHTGSGTEKSYFDDPSLPPLPHWSSFNPSSTTAYSKKQNKTFAKGSLSAPSTYLSTLARYLAHTALTANAIEAEFQVAYGRKVRFDVQLGRVRATYDYAMKSARTQAERRAKGEYNRSVVRRSVVRERRNHDVDEQQNGVSASANDAYRGGGASSSAYEAENDETAVSASARRPADSANTPSTGKDEPTSDGMMYSRGGHGKEGRPGSGLSANHIRIPDEFTGAMAETFANIEGLVVLNEVADTEENPLHEGNGGEVSGDRGEQGRAKKIKLEPETVDISDDSDLAICSGFVNLDMPFAGRRSEYAAGDEQKER